MNLSEIEKKTLLEMLSSLSHYFGIAGCNDFSFPNDHQHRAFMEQILRHSYRGETLESELRHLTDNYEDGISKEILTTDSLVLSYLKARLRELGPPPTQ